MTDFYDALETRDPGERERQLLAALPAQVQHAQSQTRSFARLLAGVAADQVNSRAALAQLPVTRKSELLALQQASREQDAFGGLSAIAPGPRLRRIFASPGPIYEPEGAAPDYWRTARALFAAGFRAGELVHNCFSYHMTPAGAIMESGAHALGCTVFAGGTGQTEQQLEAIAHLRPSGYAGTPSFLKILLEKAAEKGQPLGFRKALVSGEAYPPSLHAFLAAHGVHGTQCYATADLGLIAYETSAREGLVVDEGVLLEIVRPGTGDPVPEGEVGEVVVTTFNPDYPLIRFGTGDLSAVLPGPCPTGRSNVRIKGWLGRADQTTKVRGMFVHPGQVAAVARRFSEVQRARLVVQGQTGEDRLTLKVACTQAPEGLSARLAEVVREVTKLRAEIEILPADALPNDGKVIEDARSYD